VREFRSAIRCFENKSTLIPIVRGKFSYESKGRIKSEWCFPIAAIRYGFGYLIHCGIALKEKRPQDFKLVIEAIQVCLGKLREEGYL
jgi:hypothetical protein